MITPLWSRQPDRHSGNIVTCAVQTVWTGVRHRINPVREYSGAGADVLDACKVIWLVWRAVNMLSRASVAFWRAMLSSCTEFVLPMAMANVARTASRPIISTTMAMRVSSNGESLLPVSRP